MAAGKVSWRGRRAVVPPPANRPRFGSITPKVARRGGDADVDAAEHLHAAGHARPVDGGDDRLVELDVAEHGPGAVVEPAAVDLLDLALADLLGQLGDLRDVRLEVGAGHEVAGHARDDREPEVVVVAEVLPRAGQVAEVVEVERVAGLGPVDGDEHDVLVGGAAVGRVLLDMDRHERNVADTSVRFLAVEPHPANSDGREPQGPSRRHVLTCDDAR